MRYQTLARLVTEVVVTCLIASMVVCVSKAALECNFRVSGKVTARGPCNIVANNKPDGSTLEWICKRRLFTHKLSSATRRHSSHSSCNTFRLFPSTSCEGFPHPALLMLARDNRHTIFAPLCTVEHARSGSQRLSTSVSSAVRSTTESFVTQTVAGWA